MKILEISPFSAGICGVSTRVLAEAKLLAKDNHDVTVFSSNIFRGGDTIKETDKNEEVLSGVRIKRFKTKGSFGENTFFWDYEKDALRLKPNIIITHAYRQYYSTKAIKIAKKLNIPCILVTHAPFLDKNLRNWKLNFVVTIYDNFIGKKILNRYSKILTITKWEVPHLLKLGCNKDKIEYLPNGIPEEFFKLKLPKRVENNKIFFFGRISPIKNLEVLIKAIFIMKNSKIKLDIIGPAEKSYKSKLKKLIKELNLEKQIKFYPAIYNLKKKIKLIDNYEIFVLPSKREAMPQSLIEVMSRKKIVVSSDTEGGKEIIKEGYNGFLFENNNECDLANILSKFLKMSKHNKKFIKENARKSVKQFSWRILINRLEDIISKTL